MAGRAVVDDALVIEMRIRECRWRMADRAVLVGWDVRWIDPGILPRRIHTVMAGRAIVRDAGVIEHGRRERTTRKMADATILGGHHMVGSGVLSGGVHTVVAGIAPAPDHVGTCVINKGIGEAGRVVANGAITVGIVMNGTRRHASRTKHREGRTAIVAGRAPVRDTDMIEHRRGEHVAGMADPTILIRRQMGRTLNQIRAGREKLTRVAAFASGSDIQMNIGQKRRESEIVGELMAGAAVVLGRNMVDLLRRRDTCIVAGRAVIRINSSMAVGDSGKGSEVPDIVAVRAIK